MMFPGLSSSCTFLCARVMPSDHASESNEDDDETIILPVLKYGYRTTAASWSELEAIVASGDLARLSRSRQQQIVYERYKHSLLKTWNGVLNYMLCAKFDYLAVLDEQTGKQTARPPQEFADRIIRKLLTNDFPYFMEESIQHWILWKIGGDCSQDDIVDAEQELTCKLGGSCDFIHWVNPPHLKSLPEIDHIHILVRVHDGQANMIGITTV